jgi:hypothetical protein
VQWSIIDLGPKIVICQLEFSLDILLRNLALFNLKAMGYLQKQCKLSQLLKTQPNPLILQRYSFLKKFIFDLITFKKGKFQKVKILDIFWHIFKDRAEAPFKPKSMKSLRPDQVPNSIKPTTVFKIFIG